MRLSIFCKRFELRRACENPSISLSRMVKLGGTTIILSFIAFLLLIHSAHAVTLKRTSMISNQSITVADIFDGAGDKGAHVLGPAPQPGTDMTLNARTLMRIASALNLNWKPSSTADTATLKRAATIINHDDIKAATMNALKAKGANGDFDIRFDTGTQSIVLPENMPQSIDFFNVQLNEVTGRFNATVYAPSKDNPIYTETIHGSLERLTEIPVLSNTLRHGAIIGVRDINFIKVKSRDMSSNMVVDANEVVGMTPRKSIMQGEPIRLVDLARPKAVSRGSLVTVIFQSGPLQLTAEGKALQNGAEGDTIRVVNTASNKTLQGFVSNANEVTVKAF